MRTALVVPTYQEAGNIERFLKEVRAVLPDMTVIVCDDNSPDGTGTIAEQVAADLGQIKVLHRPGKQGLNTAHLHALRCGLDEGYERVVTMDADGSHQPRQIARLLAASDSAGFVIGTRFSGTVVRHSRKL